MEAHSAVNSLNVAIDNLKLFELITIHYTITKRCNRKSMKNNHFYEHLTKNKPDLRTNGVDCQQKTNLESNNRKLLDFLKFIVDTIKVDIMVKIKQ